MNLFTDYELTYISNAIVFPLSTAFVMIVEHFAMQPVQPGDNS